MGKKRKSPTKTPISDLSAGELEELIVDFVRRLRRVALHPLALDDSHGGDHPLPGDLLRKLMRVDMEVDFDDGGQPLSMTTLLPDEVQFESLATRVRVFMLEQDRLYWRDALRALDRLTGVDDWLVEASSKYLRTEWQTATGRRDRVRNYWVLHPETGAKFTDVDLAFGWLYQDLAHGDANGTGAFSVQQRYEAAVGVFSHLAVVALETLHYINALAEMGVVTLPVGTFSDRVITYPGGNAMKVTSLSEVEVGANLIEVMSHSGPLAKTGRSAREIAEEMRNVGYWTDAQTVDRPST